MYFDNWSVNIYYITAYVDLLPFLKMPALTQQLIYQKTKKADLGEIQNLNIWGAKLDDISIMSKLPSI